MASGERALRRPAGAALVLLATSLAVAACFRPAPRSVPAPDHRAAMESVQPVPLPPCDRIVRVELSKRERRLRARCERGGRVDMTAAFGRAGGPKQSEGDTRTPEGSYRVSGPARSSRFHLFIPIDYPSLADADAALADGRLAFRDYARIRLAHEGGAPPPGDTKLGGGLGLHGEGPRWRGDSAHIDWTQGCVAVTDPEIEYLAQRLAVGTPVIIGP